MSEEIEVTEVVAEVVEEMPTARVMPLAQGWHLVEFGCWSVSVSEDGQIRLPQAVSPESVGDLCGALTAAAEVGALVIAENRAREAARSDAERLGVRSRRGVVVSDSGVPAGAIRVPISSFPSRSDQDGLGR